MKTKYEDEIREAIGRYTLDDEQAVTVFEAWEAAPDFMQAALWQITDEDNLVACAEMVI